MRISQNLITDSIVRSLHQNQSALYTAQMQTASGKRFSSPSEDPLGMSRSLEIRRELDSITQYMRNIDSGTALLGYTDSLLGQVDGILVEAKDIALAQSTATADPSLFPTIAGQVDDLIEQALSLFNSTYDGRYMFAGTAGDTVPFTREADGSVTYRGNEDPMDIFATKTLAVDISMPGSEMSTGAPASLGGSPSDLDPDIDLDTLLDTLNGGDGVSRGSIKITDMEGNEALVDLTSTETIDDVLEAINERTDINVSASINSEENGIDILDTSLNPLEDQNLVIEEADGGSTALDLGILAYSTDGLVEGIDIDPALTRDTPVELLHGGDGLLLGRVNIHNGDYSTEVDFFGADTVGDLLDMIEGSGTRTKAEIDDSGNSILVTSSLADTTLVIADLDRYNTGHNLGITGTAEPLDFFEVLETLREGLLESDTDKIASTIEKLNSSINAVTSVRAEVGTRVNDLELAKTRNQDAELMYMELLSENEDLDYADALIELTNAQMVYETSLAASTQLLGISLVNFLR